MCTEKGVRFCVRVTRAHPVHTFRPACESSALQPKNKKKTLPSQREVSARPLASLVSVCRHSNSTTKIANSTMKMTVVANSFLPFASLGRLLGAV